MDDSNAQKLFILDSAILFFTFFGAVWTSISCGGWVRKKLRPPEKTQTFGGKEALMLEELYADMLNKKHNDELKETKDFIEDLHKWQDKEVSNCVKLWYSPRAWGARLDKLDDLSRDMTHIKNAIDNDLIRHVKHIKEKLDHDN